jgi:hypothetical protein
VVKLVDTGDSKSPAFAGVPVRVRPLVPSFKKAARNRGLFCAWNLASFPILSLLSFLHLSLRVDLSKEV